MPPFVRALLTVLMLPILLAGSCAVLSPQSATGQNDAPQGWDKLHRVAWHTASQGSRLIPKDWFDALERPDATSAFLDKDYVAGFRYLPGDTDGLGSSDPGCPFDRSLPLGFTVDCQNDDNFSSTKLRWQSSQSNHEPWVGLNCSACHTAELSYKGTVIRVEGGPTLADFQSFTEQLEKALQQTATDQAKFDRFAAKVPHADKAMLATALARLNDWNSKLARLNDPTVLRYGFGRLDAVGHILNKVSLVATPDNIDHQIANPSDAPVSYPFLWNVPQLDTVEWNGIAPRIKVGAFQAGALVRNTTEVIGVFADLKIKSAPGLSGYDSSIQLRTLESIETQLASLLPPKWPDVFPKVDAALAQKGAALFDRQCKNCHTVPASPDNLRQSFTVTLQPVLKGNAKGGPTNTDMWMACNALLDQANSGLFKGTNANMIAPPTIPATAPSITLATNAAVGVLLANKATVFETAIPGIFGFNKGLPLPRPLFQAGLSAKQVREAKCLGYQDDPTNPKLVYKGRPLQGVWATAPYLHNGSVPNLWQLLLPPAQRMPAFLTGTREFDPKLVGFETASSAAGNSFRFDTAIAGNANTGHDYGSAAMSDDDRWALLEYLKTL